MELKLGGLFFRHYSGGNWTHLELGVVTHPNGGLARRESAVQVGFKSEHALERFSVDNTADRFIAPDGSITYGRICVQGTNTYSLSAEQIYTARLMERTLRAARQQAESQAQQELATAAIPPIDITAAGAAAA